MILVLPWEAGVVGRMHASSITGNQLAKEAGLSVSYLSAVLKGKKGGPKTQQRITAALECLEAQKRGLNPHNANNMN